MPTYKASSEWNGTLEDGSGRLGVDSGAFDVAMGPKPKEGRVTNPEEVVGSALAGCYALLLARTLSDAGHRPVSIRTEASVDLEQRDGRDGRARIPEIRLEVEVEAEGLEGDRLRELAQEADEACPVSQALRGTELKIDAHLSGAPARG